MSANTARPQDHGLAADELLASEDSLVVASGGRVILCGNGPGIKPIMEAREVLGDGFVGAAVADRVVGMAAALFLHEAGVSSVFGEILSEHARDYLVESGIYVEGETVVPHITNRRGDDLCPLERIAVENPDPEEARSRIREFLADS